MRTNEWFQDLEQTLAVAYHVLDQWSHAAAMQVVAVYTAQTALFKTINMFAPEKQLVRAERTKGSYGAAPYFISKVLADLPVAALYPLVFSSIVYPMANLQPKVPRPLHSKYQLFLCIC